MAGDWILPFLAGVVSAAFTVLVGAQWLRARRPHQLAWALGLAAYSGASAVEAWVAANGWSVPLYRAYLPMAGVTVGLLGLGTLLLALRRGRAVAVGVVAVLCGVLAIGQFAVPVGDALAGRGADVGAAPVPFPQPARVAFLLLNVAGGLALIGGALWSWWRTRRAGVLLIGVGAMLPFAGGSLSTIFGLDARIVLQLLGIVVMFAGYLQGREAAARPPASAPVRG